MMTNTEFNVLLEILEELKRQTKLLEILTAKEQEYYYIIRINGVMIDKKFFILDEASWYIENNIDNWWKEDVWLAPISDVMRVELESTEYVNYVALDENNKYYKR